ncbi:RNA helicase [Trifolium repens]|nr:RNA helicase [Trifolium repens]
MKSFFICILIDLSRCGVFAVCVVVMLLFAENDIDLIGKIEGLIEKNLEKIEYKETKLLSLMKKVFSAKNVAEMKI